MADTDSDYSASTGSEDDSSIEEASLSPAASLPQKRRSNTPSVGSYESPNKQARLPQTLRALVPLQKHITKQLKGHDIDERLSLRIVAASLQLQKDYLQAKARTVNTQH